MLINLVEDWREKFDKDFVVGAIFMDLSKAFDCIPNDLIIAKLHAYGFDENVLFLIYSYLKRRKQCVWINNSNSSLKNVVSGVPKGYVLGPIVFNFFKNDLFLFLKMASLYNNADDNTLSYFSKTMTDLVRVWRIIIIIHHLSYLFTISIQCISIIKEYNKESMYNNTYKACTVLPWIRAIKDFFLSLKNDFLAHS